MLLLWTDPGQNTKRMLYNGGLLMLPFQDHNLSAQPSDTMMQKSSCFFSVTIRFLILLLNN